MSENKEKNSCIAPQKFKNSILSEMINSFNKNEENSQFKNKIKENLDFNNNNNEVNEYNNLEENLREEYPQYFIKEFKTPIEFKYSNNPLKEKTNKNNQDIILSFINKYEENIYYNELLKKLNLIKWLSSYSIITGNQIQSISLVLNHFKNNFSFNCSSILCEVKEVLIVDCIQVLTVIDIKLNKKKIILTNYENKNNFLIDDYFLREGDIILFRTKQKLEEKFLKLNTKEIQKIC